VLQTLALFPLGLGSETQNKALLLRRASVQFANFPKELSESKPQTEGTPHYITKYLYQTVAFPHPKNPACALPHLHGMIPSMSKITHNAAALTPAIRQIRGTDVVLDFEVAEAYGVPTRALVQAVKRNSKRFPSDFMFQLSKEETQFWRSQIVTSNPNAKMGLRRNPHAFTEQGVAMLSGVLHSPHAIKVNIAIMRSFIHMRKAFLSLAAIEKKFKGLDEGVVRAFVLIRALMKSSAHPGAESGKTKALPKRLSKG
jgi:hypothetical protein